MVLTPSILDHGLFDNSPTQSKEKLALLYIQYLHIKFLAQHKLYSILLSINDKEVTGMTLHLYLKLLSDFTVNVQLRILKKV